MLLSGLIGWPVGHSKSPAMHQAAFRAAGVDGVYVLLPVHPDDVGEAVRGLRALGFRGVNVTVPHKQAVMPFLDTLTPEARAIGAVNTILVQENGTLLGHNTDAAGFLSDLESKIGVPDATKISEALILGAGGSARAVTYALARSGVPTRVLARRPEQAQALAQALRPHTRAGMIHPHAWTHLPELAANATLIVNCTPLGMTPHTDASPWPENLSFRPEHIIYDLVYNPPQTRLMSQALAAGARAFNGLGMLIHQGALAWELWTGLPAPIEAMQQAIVTP